MTEQLFETKIARETNKSALNRIVCSLFYIAQFLFNYFPTRSKGSDYYYIAWINEKNGRLYRKLNSDIGWRRMHMQLHQIAYLIPIGI